ncbi:MAG TPA: hypothetical protein DIS88_07195 [Prevotella sp.]|nr:hypothetical protein [Prevotella sp.]
MSRLWTIKQKHSVGGDFLRLICIIICLLGNKGFAQTAWDGTIASKFGGGDGETESTAYQIKTPQQLAFLIQQINAGQSYKGKYFKLTSDIILNENVLDDDYDLVNPAALELHNNKPFEGSLDGQWHTIKGLVQRQDRGTSPGLFYCFRGLYIKKLKLLDVYIGSSYGCGGICSQFEGDAIMNCEVQGSISSDGDGYGAGGICQYGYILNKSQVISGCTFRGKVTNSHRAAGICSQDGQLIINCVSYGTISSKYYASGISSSSKLIENCKNYGNIVAKTRYASGIANSGSIFNCTNYGKVTSEGGDAGGISGSDGLHIIVGCVNYGKVEAIGEYVGGIASQHKTIKKCANFGTIIGKSGSSKYVGGICGSINSDDTISYCYNKGSIISYGSAKGSAPACGIVGGICGLSRGISSQRTSSITHCYNYGDISALDAESVGGIVGEQSWSGLVSYCYNKGKISGYWYVGGVVGNGSNVKYSYNVGRLSSYHNVCGICADPADNYSDPADNYYAEEVIGNGDNQYKSKNNTQLPLSDMFGEGLFKKIGDDAQWIFIRENTPLLADMPGQDILLSCNDGNDGYYYNTFYCSKLSFNVMDNSELFKAKEQTSSFHLTNVGKCAFLNHAVIIRNTDSQAKLQSVTGDFTSQDDAFKDNDLLGCDMSTPVLDKVTTGYAFVLSMLNNTVGFYRYNAETFGNTKAYFYNNSGAAKAYVFNYDGCTTPVKPIKYNTLEGDAWYTINGLKLNGKPTAPGLYIYNHKKIIIK